MNEPAAELLAKIRQQFDTAPYPCDPLDKSPKNEYEKLFIHSLVTPSYLRSQQVIQTAGTVILDAGCGSGSKSLALAEANPGAKIVGVDLSEKSIDLARQRLLYHGFEQTEFYPLAIESLPQLGLQFDYINCDEVLYLFPDIASGLSILKSVLKPHGILRANLHSAIQRFNFFRAQQVFKMMGLLDSNPETLEIELVLETMKALKDGVDLKSRAWNANYETKFDEKKLNEFVLMNYLFQGDKGYTVPDLFAALHSADLEFVSMVNWRQWELLDLFQDQENLPPFWAMSLPEISIEQRLHLFELLHPIHRLLDFWCGHPDQTVPFKPTPAWEPSDWQRSRAYLNPILSTEAVKADLLSCIHAQKPFEISRYIPSTTVVPINIESHLAASCLLPLWDGGQSVASLLAHWLKLHPIDPVTLQPTSEQAAFEAVTKFLGSMEAFLYVLLELPAHA
ncbi:MAG: methyltransferase domain-containing protein [Verrucomicrobia bacterium]|nr:methyltransferase domain-containing protein [Leptolyngbya sp. ES-bin-22]